MKVFVRCFTLIELLVVTSHLCCDRSQSVSQKNSAKRAFFSPAHGQVNRNRFTLIELLVVIAVIAVLAAMLLPALSKAKETGRMALCMGNMRNMSTAYAAYTSSHDDYHLPFTTKVIDPALEKTNHNSFKTPYFAAWCQLLAMQSPKEFRLPKSFTKGGMLLKKYLPKWVACPSAKLSDTAILHSSYNYLLAYSHQCAAREGFVDADVDAALRRCLFRVSKIKSPGSVVVIYEGGKYGDTWNNSYIPGTADAGLAGGSTLHMWDFWKNFSTGGVRSDYSSVQGKILKEPATSWVYQDFTKGRHAKRNVGMFFDGHAQNAPSRVWGREYWISFKNYTGWFYMTNNPYK